MEDTKKYYSDQIKKINPRKGYQTQIKMQNEIGHTNWMGLNDESASVLVKWLTDNFNIKP